MNLPAESPDGDKHAGLRCRVGFFVRTSGPPVREEKNCLYIFAIYNTFLKEAGNVPGLLFLTMYTDGI